MFRLFSRLYAFWGGYFWLPCPVCGEHFGGHESGFGSVLCEDGRAYVVCYKPECNMEAWRRRQACYEKTS
jgi:hypothetical protein